MAFAMPQAMERSVASPTINARFAVKNPISFSSLLAIRIAVHDQTLSRPDLVMLVQAVPALELRHRDLILPRNAEDRVAAAYGVQHPAAGGPTPLTKTPGG